MLPVVIVVIGVRAEQLDLLVAHEAENEREDLHEHGDIRGEDEKPNVVRRCFVVIEIITPPVAPPGLIKPQPIEKRSETQWYSHQDISSP